MIESVADLLFQANDSNDFDVWEMAKGNSGGSICSSLHTTKF